MGWHRCTVPRTGGDERNRKPARSGRKADDPRLPVNPERVEIVPRRAHWRVWTGNRAATPQACKRALESFGGLHPGLDVQIADQRRVLRFERAIHPVVERA